MKPSAEPVTGIPVGGAPAPAASAWSSGLFDCFDDCGLCKHLHTHAIFLLLDGNSNSVLTLFWSDLQAA